MGEGRIQHPRYETGARYQTKDDDCSPPFPVGIHKHETAGLAVKICEVHSPNANHHYEGFIGGRRLLLGWRSTLGTGGFLCDDERKEGNGAAGSSFFLLRQGRVTDGAISI